MATDRIFFCPHLQRYTGHVYAIWPVYMAKSIWHILFHPFFQLSDLISNFGTVGEELTFVSHPFRLDIILRQLRSGIGVLIMTDSFGKDQAHIRSSSTSMYVLSRNLDTTQHGQPGQTSKLLV